MKRLGLLLMLVLVACTSGQPSAREEQAAKPAAAQQAGATFYREGLTGVDFSGLDSVQKERALQIMNGNKCACPCQMSIAQCRVEDKSCPKSPGMAATVVNAIKSGQTDQQIVAALNTMRAQANAAAGPAQPPQPVQKVSINTAGEPFLGKENAKVTVVTFGDFQ
jgi:protein-disulfide isomerase